MTSTPTPPDDEAIAAIIAALTAPPEKPRVDAHALWQEICTRTLEGREPQLELIVRALRACGCEVVE
jgi:hypothetical protein